MPDPIIQPIDPTIAAGEKAGMLNDSLRQQLQSAYEARAAEDGARMQRLTSPTDPTPPAPATPPRDNATGRFTTQAQTPAPAIATTVAPGQPTTPARSTTPAPQKLVPGVDYPKDRNQWDEWKTKARAEMRKELETELSSKPAPELMTLKQQLEAISKERDEFSGRLREVAIERDPAFEREFQTAVSAVTGMAKTVVGIAHADAVEKVLQMLPSESRDAAVEKLMEGLPAYKQTQIGLALGRMDEIRATKAVKVADAQANWQKYQQESNLAREREQNEGLKQFERIVSEWSDAKNGLAVLQYRDGDTEWNSKVDETKQLAKSIFGGELELPDLAKAAVWAASAPRLLEQLMVAQKRVQELEGGKTTDASLQPGATGNVGTLAADTTQEPDYKGMNYGQIIAAKARAAGVGLP